MVSGGHVDGPPQSARAAAGGTAADEHVTRGGASRVSQLQACMAVSTTASLRSLSQKDPVEPAEQGHRRHLQLRSDPLNEMHGSGEEQQVSSSAELQVKQSTPAPSLQDFEKLGLLGTGGAAVVYLVRHRASRELFALKMQQISPSDLQNRQTQRAFKELQILKALQHPFVARLHDAFQDGANLCLVMELYEGGNLKDVQTFCGGRFQEQEAKFYAAELVLALEYVHTMGFVYRDLKPQNVLVQGDGHIRLTDFGVAQHGDHMDNALGGPSFNGATDDRVRLRSISFVGTMDYMAPEMIQQKAQSTDVDWWTLGCLLYELLYGTPPFSHYDVDSNQETGGSEQDPAALFKEILKCRVQFPTEPRVSGECKDLLRRLLEKSPEKRLGHGFGANEVKQHKFFQGVQWALVGNQSPPVVAVGSSSCVRRFYPVNLGSEALEELAGIEQALLGKFDSGDWTWAHHSAAQPEDDDVVVVPKTAEKPAPLSRSGSATSDPEDTCDEELDRCLLVILSKEQQCRECLTLDKRMCLKTKYQRNELFSRASPQRSLRDTSSFIDSMLRKSRDSFRPQSSDASLSASSVRTASSFRVQTSSKLGGGDEVREFQSAAPRIAKDKSAWTIFTDRAVTFLD